MYLAENLKFLREQNGKTQGELAVLFGIEQKTISSWECGSRKPPIGTIVSLAKLYRVSLDDLVLTDMRPPIPVYALTFQNPVERNFREAYEKKAAEAQNTNALPDFVAKNKVLLQKQYVPAIEKKEPVRIEQEKEPEPKPLTEEQREERARKFEEIRRKILGGEAE